ncbi:MAG: hypothetical protein FJ271_04215 [Planctomycetes bacterium]|nr:hypothetical protein [Planctomycetota bacterium]
MALPLFALTLFVSAFLLFLVQPMIGKLILPKLGGTPQVWNTCMVFFQAALLAGYAYTHTVSTKLPTRKQLLIHAVLLFIPCVFLFMIFAQPFSVTGFLPPPGANPIPYTLVQLTLLVGLPFFVVATTAPLLQKWFGYTGHPAAKDPYFLYGASNLGSMLSLLAYPFLIEPYVLLSNQAWVWAFSYLLLLGLVLLCVLLVWQSLGAARLAGAGGPVVDVPPTPEMQVPPDSAPAAAAAPATPTPETAIKKPSKIPTRPSGKDAEVPSAPHATDEVTTYRKLRWVGLAAVPSSLMLGVTTHITTDLSPIPLIWLLGLSLYLLSFILVFAKWPVVWTEKPHTFMLYLQPVALGLMIFMDFLATKEHNLTAMVIFLMLGFFWTTMVCHGELARDRPSTKHLTEFYLMMSVGGVVGGIFNGLIAPILFPSIWEFPIAVAAACFLRPTLKDGGWVDDVVSNNFMEATPVHHPKKGKHQPRSIAKADANPSFHYMMDVVLGGGMLVVLFALLMVVFPSAVDLNQMGKDPRGRWYFIMFGLPLMVACFFYGRPLRFGLAVTSVLLVSAVHAGEGRDAIYAGRSYFGVIRVFRQAQRMPDSKGDTKIHTYTQLLHGTTDHGMNFSRPKDKTRWHNPEEDYSRLATTYYHQLGPAGRGMQKFNWFGDKVNYYNSDARMPASLVGLGAASALVNLPTAELTGMWSEPPYATIGLGTGTMASYGRPFQHVHFYEIDNVIKNLSLGSNNTFSYLKDAKKRGSEVQVFMGDARTRMAQPYQNFTELPDTGGGPDGFYHLMVVDAFSSDAIPVHLITKEAIAMYFKKLVPEGILCVHTSNRHVDLVKVVADVTDSLGFKCKRGHDQAPGGRGMGQYTSEWVLIAREQKDLDEIVEPADYTEKLRQAARNDAGNIDPNEPYFNVPTPSPRSDYLWTDDYSNLIAVLRRRGG